MKSSSAFETRDQAAHTQHVGHARGMFAVLRGIPQTGLLMRAKAVLQDHSSNIYSKPPKDKIGPGQTLFTMSVFAVSLLAPAGWIIRHIPEYRKRARPPAEDAPPNNIM
ncbi:hypothetical protein AAFF_G00415630 [Aldrovandia affinis]|uniref:Uncharacterized protein n=1 Tax=Aldrovandia affinis TaxID=143900 RepID=A0AAD7SAV7_9TELE|nr:hypothetical protein AAFF_G00415630 [Aldrovandia affinis]